MSEPLGCEQPPLVAPSLTDSYEILPGRCDAGLLLVCDHAVNTLPGGYGTLGLEPAELSRHIAYDIGAWAVTQRLTRALNVPAIGARFSRLLIDPNRGLDDPTLIMRLSDGAVVGGNRRVDTEEREKRVRLYYEPYHLAIDGLIERCMAAGVPPVLLSVHSFTELWRGVPRPWDAAILWDRDYRFAVRLLESLRADRTVLVGENEPYDGKLAGDCMWQHGTRRGLAHTIVEVRQDLIRKEAGQARWAERIADATRAVLNRPDLAEALHTVQYFGSHTDSEDAPPVPSPRSEEQPMNAIDPKLATELEAAAFRRLVQHLRERTDVQNIDLMDLAGFCRNCLSNWYQEAAADKGVALAKEQAREIVYGMPYEEWKARHQTGDAQQVAKGAHKA